MRTLRAFDIIALACVCLSLIIAFGYQIVGGELPCAMCNLERVGFIIFGGGLLLNLRSSINPWNHVVSAFGALVGSLVALLQMFVHVMPGTPPTGTAFLGLHMYDWSYIILTGAMFYSLISLAFLATTGRRDAHQDAARKGIGATVVSSVFIAIVGANLVSAFLENGFHPFKGGGQRHYQILYDGDVMKP